MSFPSDYDGAWNFEDDEEFLEFIRVSPWSGTDRNIFHINPDDEERLMTLYSASIIEDMNEHAFSNPEVDPNITFPPMNFSEFEAAVREDLADSIADFLSFADANELREFVENQINKQ